MSTVISLSSDQIDFLDLSPVRAVIETWENPADPSHEPIQFEIDYPQDDDEPVELPEIPEVRLWFIRLDAIYPWLPYVLDWRSGELARYAAMLVPHQFSEREGIQYNPQALDIFLMSKLCALTAWTDAHQVSGTTKLKQMAEMFGYDIESQFFDLLQRS
ncbi:MAG: CRR6 family NdhI maturation factor [Cyanobacteria bacterium P01_F01_bin.42]